MIKPIVSVALLFVATLATTPAIARDKSWPVGNDQYHVYYRDLDMNRSGDRAEMLARVERAAFKLCDARHSNRADVQACVSATVRESMPGSPMLRLALQERSGVRLTQR